MTTCIKCGKQIPDGELFCQDCSLNAGISQPKQAPLPAGRMQKPAPPQPRSMPSQPDLSTPARPHRAHRAVIFVLSLLCAALLAGCAWLYFEQKADRTALAQRADQLETSTQELQQLQAELDAQQQTIFASEQTISQQEETIRQLQKKADFLDQYVVCTEPGGDGLYHKYGCSRLTGQAIRVYTPELAAANGLKPCPDCIS